MSTDLDAQDIIVLNIERAVQQCVDISAHVLVSRGLRAPSSMSAGFSDLASAGILDVDLAGRLSRAVGFRNIAVHEYQEMDVQILYSIISMHLDDFREFARCVVAVVE
ncbi:hypothetical protein L21SP2_3168 [Salinispira pacifica]|uniref:DUF86 domain-containing protein n=1 Tax=Salinispira pacifica TaxID=1307761 RepID=V5WLN3_9SPIO|nr:hypothetical protein L21SP2_3168 [Salinispira pacifica]